MHIAHDYWVKSTFFRLIDRYFRLSMQRGMFIVSVNLLDGHQVTTIGALESAPGLLALRARGPKGLDGKSMAIEVYV